MTDKKNPRPKAKAALKRYLKQGLKQEFARLRTKLSILRMDCDEYIYSAVRGAIDKAIEEAYNEGLEHGKHLK